MKKRKPNSIHLVPNDQDASTTQATINRLVELSSLMDKAHEFKVGQIVKWKSGLKFETHMDYGEPAIIRKVLVEPLYDTSSNWAHTAAFNEPLDIVIGVINKEFGFLEEYHVDKRRLEPFENERGE